MWRLGLLVCSAVAGTALSAPRVVAKYTDHGVWRTFAADADVFYGLTGYGSGLSLLAVETRGDWSKNNVSFTTHSQKWPSPLGSETGDFGFVRNGGFLHPIMEIGYSIDVRNKTSPKVVTTGPEAYEALCFFTSNGTTYAVVEKSDKERQIWAEFVDVRAPTVVVGKFAYPGNQRDVELGSPRCDATLGLMLSSPWMVDISDVTAPKVLQRLPKSTQEYGDIDDFALDARRKLMFTWSNRLLRTWDISKLTDPLLVSEYEVTYANATVVPQEPATATQVKDARRLGGVLHNGVFMQLVGDVLYVGVPEGVTMVSTATPANPVNFATLDLQAVECTSFHVYETASGVYGVRAGGKVGEPVYLMELSTK